MADARQIKFTTEFTEKRRKILLSMPAAVPTNPPSSPYDPIRMAQCNQNLLMPRDISINLNSLLVPAE